MVTRFDTIDEHEGRTDTARRQAEHRAAKIV